MLHSPAAFPMMAKRHASGITIDAQKRDFPAQDGIATRETADLLRIFKATWILGEKQQLAVSLSRSAELHGLFRSALMQTGMHTTRRTNPARRNAP